MENEASSAPLLEKVDRGCSVSKQAGKWRFFVRMWAEHSRKSNSRGWICLHKPRYLATARSHRWPPLGRWGFGGEVTAWTGDLVEKMHLFIKFEPFPHQMLNHRRRRGAKRQRRIRRKEAEQGECVCALNTLTKEHCTDTRRLPPHTVTYTDAHARTVGPRNAVLSSK